MATIIKSIKKYPVIMKNIINSNIKILALLLLTIIQAHADNTVNDACKTEEKNHYILDRVIDVKGRQGVAVDSQFYYVSGSTALYKYSKTGELLLSNETPFAHLQKNANHIGDIDVYQGEIFAGVEYFEDGQGKDIQIAIYDAKTLKFKRTIDYLPESGQVEVSGITVDYDSNAIWMTDWVNGNYIYRYALDSGQYLGKIHLQPVPQYQQGIAYYQGHLYITADDGDAEMNEHDNLYKIKVLDNSFAHVHREKVFSEVKRVGEIEGLTFDKKNNELIVLFNRGKRIVLGMPKGLYSGYSKEIHEIYVYKMSQ